MNICFFSIVTYWHGIKGGMQIHEKLLSEELARRGNRVTIISTKHPEGKELEIQNGIEIHYLKNTAFGSKRKGWKEESFNKFIELNEKNKFNLICSTQAIIPKDIIELARKKKIPIIVILHGHELSMFLSEIKQTINNKKEFKNLLKAFLTFIYYYFFWELRVLKKCDLIIAVSDKVATGTQKWYLIDKKKIKIVFNGVETDIFRPNKEEKEKLRKSLNISSEEKLLLFFSFVTKQKGLHLIIKALPYILKSNNQVKLMVVGDGDYLFESKQLVEQLKLKEYVFFTEHIPRENTPDYINASDLFILPTLRQEGTPFALLEAMSCQKPIIASNIGGIPSIIDDGINGLLIPPGDIDELTKKTLFLLNNKDVAHRLATNAREKVMKEFSLERMVDETIKVFETTLSKHLQR